MGRFKLMHEADLLLLLLGDVMNVCRNFLSQEECRRIIAEVEGRMYSQEFPQQKGARSSSGAHLPRGFSLEEEIHERVENVSLIPRSHHETIEVIRYNPTTDGRVSVGQQQYCCSIYLTLDVEGNLPTKSRLLGHGCPVCRVSAIKVIMIISGNPSILMSPAAFC